MKELYPYLVRCLETVESQRLIFHVQFGWRNADKFSSMKVIIEASKDINESVYRKKKGINKWILQSSLTRFYQV